MKYDKITLLRPPLGLPKTGPISGRRNHLGLAKAAFTSGMVLILCGLNSVILLYKREKKITIFILKMLLCYYKTFPGI